MKRIIIAGSREFEDYELLCAVSDEFIEKIKDDDEIVIFSGHARGADRLAERYASERGYLLKIFKADWARYKKGAGPVRNAAMVREADCVIAFVGKGSGTRNLISLAEKKGIEVKAIEL